eukprot:TRINITY_DN3906_c1_g1_i1.p1 TRINITY_DN3906_c1_g1~~TRINITY_DN3906_c1_g1_i1.p1  ORF type:complete len:494 (+),score=64.46 TRINITY_DN3906_c1_g1_i1:115-1596(+)
MVAVAIAGTSAVAALGLHNGNPSECLPFCKTPPGQSSFLGLKFMPAVNGASRPDLSSQRQQPSLVVCADKPNRMFDDPFDYGDCPDLEYGDLYSKGRQDALPPRPPTDDASKLGYLKFPGGYNIETASLGPMIRGDVRACCVFVSGGVYENLLFFPVIQLLKERYPGVEIDIVATDRGKQTYEMNKNVKRAWVYPVDNVLVSPALYSETMGRVKNECYDMVMSTRQAGIGHAMLLFLSDARQKVAYVLPGANGDAAGTFLSRSLRTSLPDISQAGFYMYKEMTDYLREATKFDKESEAPLEVSPLKVGISKKVRSVARGVLEAAGVDLSGAGYVLIHGLESSSAASMRSRGDPDSQLPLDFITEVVKSTRDQVVVVIPNSKDRAKVEEAVGPDVKIVRITTPGQLAAVVDESIGVVASNTAALLLARALGKPSVGLFASPEKAALYAPDAAAHRCAVVCSKTGYLGDVDAKAASMALSTFAKEAAPNSLVYSS